MRFFRVVALAVTGSLFGQVLAAPIIVHAGTAKNLKITAQDTVNGTAVAHPNVTATSTTKVNDLENDVTTGQLPLSIYNNLGGGAVNAYITGMDINNQVVMLQPGGTFFYPNANGASTPQIVTQNVAIPIGAQGSTTTITIPGYISAARIWFAQGNLQFFVVEAGSGTSLVEPSAVNPSDPSADVNWGFVELTYNTSGVFANISYVDFVGLPLGMSLTSINGNIQSALGLVANAVSDVCNDLKAQAASDGQAWDQLCMTSSSGTPLRVLAPIDYVSITPNAFGSYWTNYINQVWSQYTSSALTINTQAAAGKVNCQVSGGVLHCAGDNRSYSKPTATDIFGCNSGPFAIQSSDNDVHRAVVPRLCAAFNRSTLLLNGGNVQPSLPSTSYYTTSPTNHFSRVVHKYEVAGTGYAFSYDDVNPSGENQSGAVSSGDPTVLAITVGGPNSPLDTTSTIPLNELFKDIEWRGFEEPSKFFSVIPITEAGRLFGFVIIGTNPRRPIDERHYQFVQDILVKVGSIAASLVSARETEARAQRLERELAASERQIRFFAQHATVGMQNLSVDGTTLWANDQFYANVGLPRQTDNAESKFSFSFIDMVIDEDQKIARDAWNRLINGESLVSSEFRLKNFFTPPSGKPEPSCILSTSFPYMESGQTKSIMTCTTDISRLKWAEGFEAQRADEARKAKRQQEEFIDTIFFRSQRNRQFRGDSAGYSS